MGAAPSINKWAIRPVWIANDLRLMPQVGTHPGRREDRKTSPSNRTPSAPFHETTKSKHLPRRLCGLPGSRHQGCHLARASLAHRRHRRFDRWIGPAGGIFYASAEGYWDGLRRCRPSACGAHQLVAGIAGAGRADQGDAGAVQARHRRSRTTRRHLPAREPSCQRESVMNPCVPTSLLRAEGPETSQPRWPWAGVVAPGWYSRRSTLLPHAPPRRSHLS